MLLTTAQQQNIREVLWYRTKYRETFNEVYDHILTSIEHQPDHDKAPHQMAKMIIDVEFGGWDGLKELEKQRERDLRTSLWKSLWTEFRRYFKLPLLVFTLLLSGCAFFATAHVDRGVTFFIMLFAVLVPMGFSSRSVSFNTWSKKYKASVKDRAAQKIGSLGITINNLLIILPGMLTDGHYRLIFQAHAALVTALLVVYVVYGFSAVKVFQNNLKKEAWAS